jgi:hypothetical protein
VRAPTTKKVWGLSPRKEEEQTIKQEGEFEDVPGEMVTRARKRVIPFFLGVFS